MARVSKQFDTSVVAKKAIIYSVMGELKTHYDYIDLAKGFGILLVILGHGMFPCHFVIDSFHMPLFFILSGLTLNISMDKWAIGGVKCG